MPSDVLSFGSILSRVSTTSSSSTMLDKTLSFKMWYSINSRVKSPSNPFIASEMGATRVRLLEPLRMGISAVCWSVFMSGPNSGLEERRSIIVVVRGRWGHGQGSAATCSTRAEEGTSDVQRRASESDRESLIAGTRERVVMYLVYVLM
jgi:hypothetical protein